MNQFACPVCGVVFEITGTDPRIPAHSEGYAVPIGYQTWQACLGSYTRPEIIELEEKDVKTS